jgi:hypothetical protein
MNKVLPVNPLPAPTPAERWVWRACLAVSLVWLAAAWAGQARWWPGAVLLALSLLPPLLRSQRRQVAVPGYDTLDVGPWGLVHRSGLPDDPQEPSTRRLAWSDIRQVDVLTTEDGPLGEDLFFVLMTQPDTDADALVVSNAQAVPTKLLDAMAQHLGPLDQAQLLNAVSTRELKRFTLWRRETASVQH